MTRIILSLLCNAALAVMTALAVLSAMRANARAEGKGSAAFRYFTTDSNILSGFAALAVVLLDIRLLVNGNAVLPTWVILFKFTSTVAVTVTFLTVIFFLGPTQGYKEMFASDGLFLHLICPLLAILSLCFFDPGAKITPWQALIGVFPTLIYGALYFVMVIKLGERGGGWKDFYGFNHNGKWPASMALMLVATCMICVLLRLLYNAAA